MDIHTRWSAIQEENAGVIMAFTTDLVRAWWREIDLAEIPANKVVLLNAYRKECFAGDYYNLKCASAEFILEQTGIELRVP